MKIERLTTIHNSFNGNTEDKSFKMTTLPTRKATAALIAALTMTAGYAKADVIDIKKAAYEYAKKEYARLKQFDTNNDGMLDEKEQSKIATKAIPVKKISKKQIAQKTEIINFIKESLRIRSTLCGNARTAMLNEQNRRLIAYRLKNLPKNFVPDPNFIQNSGLYKKIIKRGFFRDTDTGKYTIQNGYKFKEKIDILCKNRRLKDIFANNFVYYLPKIEDNIGMMKASKLHVDGINELLLPNY